MTQPSWDFPESQCIYERARRVIPGGSTRGSIFYRPHPLYAREGKGCRVRFADGHEAVDFLNNFTSLVLGHGHPAVLEAVRMQLSRGVVLGAPTELEVELASLLADRIPCVEQAVFTGTGSEAIMIGLRVARATTGREGVAKFEGGYHGGYDHAKVSAMVGLEEWGDDLEPASIPDTAGIPMGTASEVHVMRFNSLASVERVLERRGDGIGVLIVEPVLGAGGVIPPEPGFLEGLRRMTAERGILLVFDEVITQRLAPGGAQERFGVIPDLVVVSKVMGGGFPIAALGGPATLMGALDASREGGPLVYHSGTYNANPLSTAAAVATLQTIDEDLIRYLDQLGDLARTRLQALFGARRAPISVTGVGSLFNVHFTTEQPRDYRGVRRADQEALREFHLRMLKHGVLLATRGLGCTSAAMGEEEVGLLVRQAEKVLADMGW